MSAKPQNLNDTRCGIVAPDTVNQTPGYYVILGQPNLRYVKEVERNTIESLFKALTDDEEKYRFHTVYIENFQKGTAPPDFILRLRDYIKKKLPWIRIAKAHYADDPYQGVQLFNQWTGREIPKGSVLWNQLGKIEANNYEDSAFYAFTALRYVLAGFKLDNFAKYQNKAIEMRAKIKTKEIESDLDATSRYAWDELRELKERLEEGAWI